MHRLSRNYANPRHPAPHPSATELLNDLTSSVNGQGTTSSKTAVQFFERYQLRWYIDMSKDDRADDTDIDIFFAHGFY